MTLEIAGKSPYQNESIDAMNPWLMTNHIVVQTSQGSRCGHVNHG